MQLLQLSSGKSTLVHIWVVRLCAFHNLVMTHSLCFLNCKQHPYIFTLFFPSPFTNICKYKSCAIFLFCLYSVSLDKAVCISSYLLSIITCISCKKKKKRIFLPKILPFIHAHSHFCFQQLIETSGNSTSSCFVGNHPFPPKSANIHLPFPPLSSSLYNLWPNCLFNPFLHL